jgi:hypothetical protein
MKQSAFFEDDELVDAFEIVLEGIDVTSYCFQRNVERQLGKKESIEMAVVLFLMVSFSQALAEEKFEILCRFHEQAHGIKLPEVYFMAKASAVFPVMFSPEIRVRRCLAGNGKS